MKEVLGLLLSVAIGALCRWYGVPIPAPPSLYGVLMIAGVTIGYLVVGRLLKGE